VAQRHLPASDLATSGVSPQFAMLDVNLPPEMGLSSAAIYLRAIGDECKGLGIAIVEGTQGDIPAPATRSSAGG